MESIEEQKLDEFLQHTEIRTNISEWADEASAAIWEDINSRISRILGRRAIRRMLIAVTGAAAVFFAGFYLLEHRNNSLQEKQLLAQLGAVSSMDEITEVSIMSGNMRETVAANAGITHTKDGDILMGSMRKIPAGALNDEYITIVVPKGKRTMVQLSEGTKIWINSGSRLVYPRQFRGESRNVYIDGEIYLDVSRNEKMPFYVHTEKMDINVLGTKFDVNAYKNGQVNYVVLDEGSVRVERNEQENGLISGQGYFVDNAAEQIKAIDVSAYTCWKDGKMKLIDEPFDFLARKLSRYYGVKIIIEEPALNSMRFDGSITLTNSIDDVLSTLALSQDFNYRKSGETIAIVPKGTGRKYGGNNI